MEIDGNLQNFAKQCHPEMLRKNRAEKIGGYLTSPPGHKYSSVNGSRICFSGPTSLPTLCGLSGLVGLRGSSPVFEGLPCGGTSRKPIFDLRSSSLLGLFEPFVSNVCIHPQRPKSFWKLREKT